MSEILLRRGASGSNNDHDVPREIHDWAGRRIDAPMVNQE